MHYFVDGCYEYKYLTKKIPFRHSSLGFKKNYKCNYICTITHAQSSNQEMNLVRMDEVQDKIPLCIKCITLPVFHNDLLLVLPLVLTLRLLQRA